MARRSVVIDMEIRNKQARKALQGVESGFVRLSQKTKQSTTAMSKGFSRASGQVRGSQAAVSNLSRIVEDAPFGVRGVANNINPFIQSFGRLKQQTGSTTSAMKTLLTSAFTGPGAILTISALVTSAITAIQMGLFDWGEEAKDTDEQMEKLMETMDEFIEEQRQMGGENIFDPLGQATTQQKLDQVQALKDELQSLFDLRSQAKELEQTISTLRQAGAASEIGGAGDLLVQQKQKLEQVNQQLAEQERLFGELSQAEQKNIEDKIDDMEATARLNEAFLRLNPVMQRKIELNKDLRPLLRDVELGLEGAQEELQGLVGDYEDVVETLQVQIQSEKIHGEELETLKNLMMAYKNAIDQAKKSLEDLQEKQKETERANIGRAEVSPGKRRVGDFGEGRITPEEIEKNQQKIREQQQFDQWASGLQRVESEYQNVAKAAGLSGDSMKEAGNKGKASIDEATQAANLLGNALAQAIVRGEELGGVLKSLAAQLASRAIINGLGMLLTGGAFSIPKLFGFQHGTDMGFPGVGMVGEAGPEMVVAPPMSSVITNENIEKLNRMNQEARQGIAKGANMNSADISRQLRQAITEGFAQMPNPVLEFSRFDEEWGKYKGKKEVVGN